MLVELPRFQLDIRESAVIVASQLNDSQGGLDHHTETLVSNLQLLIRPMKLWLLLA